MTLYEATERRGVSSLILCRMRVQPPSVVSELHIRRRESDSAGRDRQRAVIGDRLIAVRHVAQRFVNESIRERIRSPSDVRYLAVVIYGNGVRRCEHFAADVRSARVSVLRSHSDRVIVRAGKRRAVVLLFQRVGSKRDAPPVDDYISADERYVVIAALYGVATVKRVKRGELCRSHAVILARSYNVLIRRFERIRSRKPVRYDLGGCGQPVIRLFLVNGGDGERSLRDTERSEYIGYIVTARAKAVCIKPAVRDGYDKRIQAIAAFVDVRHGSDERHRHVVSALARRKAVAAYVYPVRVAVLRRNSRLAAVRAGKRGAVVHLG